MQETTGGNPTGASSEPLLRVDGLSVDFALPQGTVHAVRNVSLAVHQGETLAILGESGSGKSVTSLTIMGLLDCPPAVVRSGKVLLAGEDLMTAAPRRRREINGRTIAMIFQDPLASLNPVYPVGWQIAETFRIHGEAVEDGHARAVGLLERVGIPDAARRAADYPHQFSGGQRQRIMIAMAVALNPDILIADEPTTALDVTIQAGILKLLRDMQRESGMGLLLITHDLAVVEQIADRVAVMFDGEIVETGDVRQVFQAPVHPYTARLLQSAPGRHGYPAATASRSSTVLLQTKDVVKIHSSAGGFGRERRATRAVDGVSFEVRQGECVGVVGESGCGKSTLARLLLGLEKPDEGRVSYRGEDVAHFSRSQWFDLRRRVQVVFQDPTASFNPYMSVFQILTEPWRIHRDVMPKDRWQAEVGELLRLVGLRPDHADRYPHQFSGGQRQRIAIARALALRPELIICDEALSALDVSLQAQILALLKDLRRDFALSYVFIAHDLPLVRDFCDRLYVMYQGKFVEEGQTAAVFERPRQPYTRRLLSASSFADPG